MAPAAPQDPSKEALAVDTGSRGTANATAPASASHHVPTSTGTGRTVVDPASIPLPPVSREENVKMREPKPSAPITPRAWDIWDIYNEEMQSLDEMPEDGPSDDNSNTGSKCCRKNKGKAPACPTQLSARVVPAHPGVSCQGYCHGLRSILATPAPMSEQQQQLINLGIHNPQTGNPFCNQDF